MEQTQVEKKENPFKLAFVKTTQGKKLTWRFPLPCYVDKKFSRKGISIVGNAWFTNNKNNKSRFCLTMDSGKQRLVAVVMPTVLLQYIVMLSIIITMF